jgi:hypothetical protein
MLEPVNGSPASLLSRNAVPEPVVVLEKQRRAGTSPSLRRPKFHVGSTSYIVSIDRKGKHATR